jgi:lipoprotein NlpI
MTGLLRTAAALLAGVLALPALAAEAAPPPAPPASAVAALEAMLARCTAPGPDRAANRACANALARHAELERAAGRNDAALAGLARADAFAPQELRYSMARAALSLKIANKLTPEGITAAAQAAPDDIGFALMHAELAASRKDYAGTAADASRALAQRPDGLLALEMRATANVAREQFDAARGDVDRALQLEPRSGAALRLRGILRNNAGDYDGALADYQLAHALSPRPDDPFVIGSTQFLARRWDEAAASLARRAPPPPEGLYWRIWRYLAIARQDGVERASGALGPGTPPGPGLPWPGPVIDYFHGSIDAARLLADAKSGESANNLSQVCEAHFYMAEDALLRQRRDALALFQQAYKECPRNFHEYEGAQAELRAANALPVAAAAAAAPGPTASAPAATTTD